MCGHVIRGSRAHRRPDFNPDLVMDGPRQPPSDPSSPAYGRLCLDQRLKGGSGYYFPYLDRTLIQEIKMSLLWSDVGAHAVRKWTGRDGWGDVWPSAGAKRDNLINPLSVLFTKLTCRQLSPSGLGCELEQAK